VEKLMELDFFNKDNYTEILIKDTRLDAKNCILFRDKVIEEVNNRGISNVLINFSNIRFMDSSGLGSLVSILKSISKNSSLALYGINSNVMITFTRTKMDKIFKIFDDYSKYLETLK
jgi:anti-sigma B factor antagonist